GDRAVAENDQRKWVSVLRADGATDLERRLRGNKPVAPGRHDLSGQRGGQCACPEQGRPTDVPDSDAQQRLLVRGSAYGLLTGLGGLQPPYAALGRCRHLALRAGRG